MSQALLHYATWQKTLVTGYKLMGFVLLSGILGGMMAFIGQQIFYFTSRSWVTPVILSANDERVLKIQAQLAEQLAERDRIDLGLSELRNQRHDAQRRVDLELQFQARFRRAASADARDRRVMAQALQHLAADYATIQPLLAHTAPAAALAAAQRDEALLRAHIIDAADYAERTAQAARMAQSHLSALESRLSVEARRQQVRRDGVPWPDTAEPSDAAHTADELSYAALLARREYDRSCLELERAQRDLGLLDDRLQAMEAGLKRQQELVAALLNSPYLRAVARNTTMAFIPYGNANGTLSGQPVYGCTVGLLWCHQVGEVLGVLDGEVTGRHPANHDELRGVMLDLRLDEGWARQAVLHVRHKPFFT